MIKSKLAPVLLLPVVLLSACQSTSNHAPVMTRADNTYETTGLGKTKTEATTAALNAANKQCGVRKAVVIEDEVRYNGVVDERMGRVIEQGVGMVGAVLGTKTPNLSRDDDYEHHIKFKCQ